ncbi:MAG: type II secretion system protein [Nitrospirae bacterium]|nr:type II secretion system protein [Magnetococcales bacterium]
MNRFIPTGRLVRISMNSIQGFTLIEMAILLAVAGTLMLGAVSAIRVQSAKANLEKTQQAMREIEQVLLGFVAMTGHLPCPDWYVGTVADGQENRDAVTGLCTDSPDGQQTGLLPWQSLGIKPMDQWGNFYSYRVSNNFTVNGGYNFDTNGDMEVYSGGGTLLLSNIPVMVISHGPNSHGAYAMNLDTNLKRPFAAATALEKENIIDDGDNPDNPNPERFYQAGDDILMWISPDVVKLRALESNWLLP